MSKYFIGIIGVVIIIATVFVRVIDNRILISNIQKSEKKTISQIEEDYGHKSTEYSR